jgi:hypothetical protein
MMIYQKKNIEQLLKILENVSCDNSDEIYSISVLFRDSFDYIIRKKYVIQTKFCLNEHDPIYFLWGFIHCLFFEPFILNYYKLFSHNNLTNNKTLKNQRIGLIHGCAVAIIYSYKKDISSSWNNSEKLILNKINDIAMNLFKQIKKEVVIKSDEKPDKDKEEKEKEKSKIDGLNYLYEYIPKISTANIYIPPANDDLSEEEYRTIIK